MGASNLAPPVESVDLLKSGKQPLTPPEQKSKDSTTCQIWKRGYKASQCKSIKAKCHACGEIGHLKHVCRSNRTQVLFK